MKLRGNSERSACCPLAKGPLNKARLVSQLYQAVQALVYLSFEGSQQEFLRALWALIPVLKKFITTEVVTLRFPPLQFVTIASCSFVLHLDQLKLLLLWIRVELQVSKGLPCIFLWFCKNEARNELLQIMQQTRVQVMHPLNSIYCRTR